MSGECLVAKDHDDTCTSRIGDKKCRRQLGHKGWHHFFSGDAKGIHTGCWMRWQHGDNE